MVALFPSPHVLCIVPTAAALIHWQLVTSTETCAILPAPRFSLRPSRLVHASANALVRVAAHAQRRVERPTKLSAAKDRSLLEWDWRR